MATIRKLSEEYILWMGDLRDIRGALFPFDLRELNSLIVLQNYSQEELEELRVKGSKAIKVPYSQLVINLTGGFFCDVYLLEVEEADDECGE